jgi:uncharacterized membrane protein
MSDNIDIDEIKDNNDMMISDDDKLWSALSWVFFPVAIIALLMEDKKARPFIRFHAWHSIIAGIVFSIISSVTLGCGTPVFIISLYFAYKAYQGEQNEIPVITDFIKGQGWI